MLETCFHRIWFGVWSIYVDVEIVTKHPNREIGETLSLHCSTYTSSIDVVVYGTLVTVTDRLLLWYFTVTFLLKTANRPFVRQISSEIWIGMDNFLPLLPCRLSPVIVNWFILLTFTQYIFFVFIQITIVIVFFVIFCNSTTINWVHLGHWLLLLLTPLLFQLLLLRQLCTILRAIV